MPNTLTLTSLAPVIYQARDLVARELTGFINSVTVNRDGSVEAAFGDSVQSFITAQPTLNESYTPAMTIPAADDSTVAADSFTLDKVANVRIPLTGETARRLDNSFGVEVVFRDLFAQGIRSMVNAIEANLGLVLKNGSSRAIGTAGTTPFGSNFSEVAQLRQILADNGCPTSDGQLSLVINTAAGTNLRNLAQLQKVNEAGAAGTLRNGELLNLQGFSLKESAQVAVHTKGTGASATITNAGFAAGTTSLPLASAGSGTILAGDVITLASDSNNYVVQTGDADVSNGGTVVINGPGLRQATGAVARAITVGNNYTANIGLHRLAAELAMRAPSQPANGDAATDRMVVADPVSGLSFSISEYKGYGMAMYDITCFYAAKVWNPKFVATLRG